MTALYHLLPSTFVGETLHPLNQLRQLHPAAAAHALRRFRGREDLLERRVPPLGCARQDTVSLSVVPPQVLVALLHDLGVPWQPRTWVAVHPSSLEPARAVVYPSRRRTPFRPETDEDFAPYDPATVLEYQTTALTREDWQQAQQKGTGVLLFSSVPSVLYQGAINITHAPRVVV